MSTFISVSIPITATAVTEEQLDALLREATDADQQAADARLWASPEYVGVAQAAAEAAWAAYRAARSSGEAALVGRLVGYVWDTRAFGATYVHSGVRRLHAGYEGINVLVNGELAIVTWGGYGRSLESAKGHKYKAWINYPNGRPVPSKLLSKVTPVFSGLGL
jgi:hypothetical protein